MASEVKAKVLREVSASGSHYNIGLSIGKQCRDQAMRSQRRFKAAVERSPGATVQKVVARAKLTLPLSREFCPEYVEEIEGYADGAGLDSDLVYAMLSDPPSLGEGCTDIAVNARWTKEDAVYAAHNDDVEPYNLQDLAILRVKPEDEPGFIGVSYGGIYPSVGLNSAGISLTGNALVPNDTRPGVPKVFACRKVLRAKGLNEALRWSMPEARGHSFNNIICDRSGEIHSMEGSATTFDALYAHEGYLVHTNHYISPRMWKFEKDMHTRMSSVMRFNRASRLVREQLGQVEVRTFKEIFSDHVGHPESICRHADPALSENDQTVTVFSVVFDLTNRAAWICAGNPCEGEYRKYEI